MKDLERPGQIFSDETELFRTPMEPDAGDNVNLRLRAAKNLVVQAEILILTQNRSIRMKRVGTDEFFDWFEGSMVAPTEAVKYVFLIETDRRRIFFSKVGISENEEGISEYAFSYIPGFHVPEWSKGAVQYQIFVDRFKNGNTATDPDDGEYYYIDGPVEHRSPDEELTDHDYRCFCGGDLQGVMSELDKLQKLGIDAIYLNPIFVSPSSHKYDTQDYAHIDPHFGVILKDVQHSIQPDETDNAKARQYIARTASIENLEASDAYFARLCEAIHARGMKIILDGVFNHCGSFNKWMDREGIYHDRIGFEEGAYRSVGSPYRAYFRYTSFDASRPAEYEGWWGHKTLPKLNYEGAPALRETIMRIAEKWASPPYCIDGWRLDVAADLGHSIEYNHDFWREFRTRMKKANPNAAIIAEHYGDASAWLQGDQWDTVMNYDAFMDPVSFFLTGMEKHSDYAVQDLWMNGKAFFENMCRNMAKLSGPSLYCAMNELSNHDHSRFLTRTNRRIGRLHTAGATAASEGIDRAIFRAGVVLQMTWPGAPTIYYGDEAGQVGWTDPDNRRAYPWGRENRELIELHRELIAMRKGDPVFTNGSVLPLVGDYGSIAYARFNAHSCVIVIMNIETSPRTIRIDTDILGIADGKFRCLFKTNVEGHDRPDEEYVIVRESVIHVEVSPKSTIVLRSDLHRG